MSMQTIPSVQPEKIQTIKNLAAFLRIQRVISSSPINFFSNGDGAKQYYGIEFKVPKGPVLTPGIHCLIDMLPCSQKGTVGLAYYLPKTELEAKRQSYMVRTGGNEVEIWTCESLPADFARFFGPIALLETMNTLAFTRFDVKLDDGLFNSLRIQRKDWKSVEHKVRGAAEQAKHQIQERWDSALALIGDGRHKSNRVLGIEVEIWHLGLNEGPQAMLDALADAGLAPRHKKEPEQVETSAVEIKPSAIVVASKNINSPAALTAEDAAKEPVKVDAVAVPNEAEPQINDPRAKVAKALAEHVASVIRKVSSQYAPALSSLHSNYGCLSGHSVKSVPFGDSNLLEAAKEAYGSQNWPYEILPKILLDSGLAKNQADSEYQTKQVVRYIFTRVDWSDMLEDRLYGGPRPSSMADRDPHARFLHRANA